MPDLFYKLYVYWHLIFTIVKYYYFTHITDVKHREVNIFNRKNMTGKCDLKVVKDIHAKALFSS